MKGSSTFLILLAFVAFVYCGNDNFTCEIPMNDCMKAWCYMNNSNASLPTAQKTNLAIYSSHTIQDLGDYKQCVKYSNISRYILGEFQNLQSGSSFYLGFCGPVNCTAEEYSSIYPIIQEYFATNLPQLNNTNADRKSVV
mgnify:CR=1 FL=1